MTFLTKCLLFLILSYDATILSFFYASKKLEINKIYSLGFKI